MTIATLPGELVTSSTRAEAAIIKVHLHRFGQAVVRWQNAHPGQPLPAAPAALLGEENEVPPSADLLYTAAGLRPDLYPALPLFISDIHVSNGRPVRSVLLDTLDVETVEAGRLEEFLDHVAAAHSVQATRGQH